jgi:phenylpyruvate tautomerase PptA (4-oxalocrotonate tautomerase family)
VRPQFAPISLISLAIAVSVRAGPRHSPWRGKSAAYPQAILDGVYLALRETFDVPEDDRFLTISEHDDADFSYGANYLGIARSEDLVVIRITANDTRNAGQQKALYRRIADRLTRQPGLRPEDVFINLVEVLPENWSFGHGVARAARLSGFLDPRSVHGRRGRTRFRRLKAPPFAARGAEQQKCEHEEAADDRPFDGAAMIVGVPAEQDLDPVGPHERQKEQGESDRGGRDFDPEPKTRRHVQHPFGSS